MTARKVAEQIAFCTCGPDLPAKMRANGKHFANCPVELVDDIEAALTRARLAALAEAAKVADEWLKPGVMELRAGEMSAQEKRTGRAIVGSIVAAIRKLGG